VPNLGHGAWSTYLAQSNRFILRGAESDNAPMICPFGNDVAVATSIISYTQGVTSADGSYEYIGSCFNYESGQRIGMWLY